MSQLNDYVDVSNSIKLNQKCEIEIGERYHNIQRIQNPVVLLELPPPSNTSSKTPPI